MLLTARPGWPTRTSRLRMGDPPQDAYAFPGRRWREAMERGGLPAGIPEPGPGGADILGGAARPHLTADRPGRGPDGSTSTTSMACGPWRCRRCCSGGSTPGGPDHLDPGGGGSLTPVLYLAASSEVELEALCRDAQATEEGGCAASCTPLFSVTTGAGGPPHARGDQDPHQPVSPRRTGASSVVVHLDHRPHRRASPPPAELELSHQAP